MPEVMSPAVPTIKPYPAAVHADHQYCVPANSCEPFSLPKLGIWYMIDLLYQGEKFDHKKRYSLTMRANSQCDV